MICPKCKKRISVRQNEFCCPLCGEFFMDEVTNDFIEDANNTVNIQLKREHLIEESRRIKSEEQSKILAPWGATLAISLGLCFSLFGFFLAPVMPIIAPIYAAIMGGWLFLGLLIPHIRHKVRIKDL